MFTTHSVEDLAACDRIVFMMRGGRVGFVGTVGEALDRFGVESIPELYNHLASSDAARTGDTDGRPRERRRCSVRDR